MIQCEGTFSCVVEPSSWMRLESDRTRRGICLSRIAIAIARPVLSAHKVDLEIRVLLVNKLYVSGKVANGQAEPGSRAAVGIGAVNDGGVVEIWANGGRGIMEV